MPPANQGCCAHDHDCDTADCGPAYSLYKHIALEQVHCLNEDVDGSCRNVFRAWDARTAAPEVPLRSDPDDEELLLTIPFDGAVKLKAVCVIGGPDGRAPSKMRLFINRDDLDFAAVGSMAAVQEFDLQEANPGGTVEYPTQPAKFGNVHALTRNRRAVEAVYELRPVPEDHRVPGMKQGGHFDVA
ncbi:hypothetical protein Rsub_11236 [Raphidocelis subcapitata]|uniref:PITH domain-containing protein n=1 Tax=Raphidocelis subcapitata TaxID=307507 RepID=A0A2V0PH56_9CHLO|nr:hypothetical protein Rsub_11236 [Raphidocelis subcapitata]|eukprot:GBF98342.1 hypothetical protein Rsub_11236 [Raphidocelis subcapitata]